MASNGQDVPKPKGLLERLRDKEAVICAEGYVMSFERRGYLQAGPFVPEVVLGRPDLVRLQYEEFVHAGSDVVVALTYYTHRARLKHIGKEDQLELINRYALRLAKGVAVQSGTLMAGNICDTSLFIPNNFDSKEAVKAVFREQVGWAVQEGADFVIGETFGHVGEAILATEVIKEAGLPAVVTLRVTNQFFVDGKLATFDGIELGQALQMLENAGADVIGFNCSTGPRTMISLLAQYRQYASQVPFAALPVAYRTNEKEVTYQDLTDPLTGQKVFPGNLDCVQCSRDEIAEFGRQCAQLGVQYLGICCGNNAGFTRALSESIGRIPPASRFRPDMSKYVSDLHRRLMYLQKLKEIADEQKEQSESNGNEQQDIIDEDQKQSNEEKSENSQMTKQDDENQDVTSGTQHVNESEQMVKEPDSKDEEEGKDNKEGVVKGHNGESNGESNLDTTEKQLPESSTDTFSVRLPPPPGHGFKRTDSKRSRSSPSPSIESNDSEIRLPPPPKHGLKVNGTRRNRASSSSSSDSNPDSNDNDIRRPSPSGNEFERTGSGRILETAQSPASTDNKQANEHSNVMRVSQDNVGETSFQADVTSSVDVVHLLQPSLPSQNNSDDQSPSLLPPSPELKRTSLANEQLPQQELDKKSNENASIQSPTEDSRVKVGESTLLLESPTQDTQLQEATSETKQLSVDVSTNLNKEGPENKEKNQWADFSANKALGEDDSPSSSGDEEQMGYVRLEKEDDRENSQSWINFSTSTIGQNDEETVSESQTDTKDNGDWANFTATKSEENPQAAASDQWANFATIQDTDGAIEILTDSRSVRKQEDGESSVHVSETSVADHLKPQGTLSIGLDEDYEDSEA